MPENQTPTIGRIVHVKVGERSDGNGGMTGIYRPAIIQDVHTESVVDLHVFLKQRDATLPFGLSYGHDRTSIQQGDQLGQWTWPTRS